jgi:hypothetical protein
MSYLKEALTVESILGRTRNVFSQDDEVLTALRNEGYIFKREFSAKYETAGDFSYSCQLQSITLVGKVDVPDLEEVLASNPETEHLVIENVMGYENMTPVIMACRLSRMDTSQLAFYVQKHGVRESGTFSKVKTL